jgi:glycosyltransferase involved in cell wall biosynthesis
LINIKTKPISSATIVIPAYNEEDGIAVVLQNICHVLNGTCEVIVVDDGSDDATAEITSRFPCRLIKHETNRGKGEALKTGIRYATKDNIIIIDADDSYPVEVIPQMAESLEHCDMVYCSRLAGRENIPKLNRLGSVFFQGLMRYIYHFKPRDYCTGLYGAKKCYLERMDLSSHGFAIEPEIAAKASRMKLRVYEIPIQYRPRIGQTKLNSFKGGLEHLWTILNLLFWYSNHNENEIVSIQQDLDNSDH